MKNQKSIIIKKVKKAGHGGHHGGQWKVAYADFVTAMMAMFLLLWLLSNVPTEKKSQIAEYFTHFSLYSAKGAALSFESMQSPLSRVGEMPDKTYTEMFGETDDASVGKTREEGRTDKAYQEGMEGSTYGKLKGGETLERTRSKKYIERQLLLETELKKVVMSKLYDIKDQILIDIVEGGIRIQLIDKEGSLMFEGGSNKLTQKGKKVFLLISQNIRELPNMITVEGHTDSTPYAKAGFSNWELSTERASTARKELEANGIAADRIARVSGFAATDPLIKEAPMDPRNRRISLIIKNVEEEPDEKKELADAVKEKVPGLKKGESLKTIEEKLTTRSMTIEEAPLPEEITGAGEKKWSPVLDSSAYSPVLEDKWRPIDSGYKNTMSGDSAAPYTDWTRQAPAPADKKEKEQPDKGKVESKTPVKDIFRSFIEKSGKEAEKERTESRKTETEGPSPETGRKTFKPVIDKLPSPVIDKGTSKPVIDDMWKTDTNNNVNDADKEKPGAGKIDKDRIKNIMKLPALNKNIKNAPAGKESEEDPAAKDDGWGPAEKNGLSPVFKKDGAGPVFK
ncbi:MAG: OmpA family protein [Nitrospirota bacterium]|nr:OmpA family protein [Nitrospirota bacterium]